MNKASGVSDFNIINDNKTNVALSIVNFDSLVVTGSSIIHNSFYGIPSYTGASLNLGTFIINTTLTGIPCPGTPTLVYGNTVYNTVKIGSQCWLKENLNVGVMIDSAANPSSNGVIEKYCYRNDTTNCVKYGGLYQWDEAMAYSTTSGVQGICPSGWHIPTEGECAFLATTVGNDGNALKAIGQGVETLEEQTQAVFPRCSRAPATSVVVSSI